MIKVEARRPSQGDPRKQGLFSRPHGLTAASTSLPLASPKSHGKLHTVLVPLSSWEAKIAPQQLHRLSLQCITDSCTPTPAQLAVCRRTGLYGGLDAAPVLRPDR